MQESDIRILCTRPLDQLLLSKAAAKNILIEPVSFITTEPVQSDDFINNIRRLLGQNIYAIFTSANGVESAARYADKKAAWKIFCTGGITKECVKKFFGEEKIIATAKNATALAQKILAEKNIPEVYFFCGDQRLDDIPRTLAANSIPTHEIISYQTIQTPQIIEEDYDGIMFFSPSAVHSFFSANTIATSAVLFSIGHTTSAVIHSYCTNKVITSEWPGAENLVQRVIEHYQS